jgi:hypothetical protein
VKRASHPPTSGRLTHGTPGSTRMRSFGTLPVRRGPFPAVGRPGAAIGRHDRRVPCVAHGLPRLPAASRTQGSNLRGAGAFLTTRSPSPGDGPLLANPSPQGNGATGCAPARSPTVPAIIPIGVALINPRCPLSTRRLERPGGTLLGARSRGSWRPCSTGHAEYVGLAGGGPGRNSAQNAGSETDAELSPPSGGSANPRILL